MLSPEVSRLEEIARAGGDLARIEAALQRLEGRHVGLESRLPALAALPASEPWIADELIDMPGWHASLFLVAKGRRLPLHDHPEMTVLLRVLAGRFAVRSYDWAPEGGGLARVVADRVVTADDPVQVLRPREGNLHRIEALEDGAFFDLFSPYYAEDEGRPCTYYREAETVAPGLVRLVECTKEEALAAPAISP